MLMVAVVISSGFLTPSAQAEKSAEFDFWFERVDPATGKSEKMSGYTLDDLVRFVIVIKNNGIEYISTANVKYGTSWRDYSVTHIPHFATRFFPSSAEWERKWEVNLKPGEEKRIEEMKSGIDWIKFYFSFFGYTLTNYNADDATIVAEGKVGPFTIKGIKTNLADSKYITTIELFIDGKSFGKRSCKYICVAKAD
jgi:hypothetical protein